MDSPEDGGGMMGRRRSEHVGWSVGAGPTRAQPSGEDSVWGDVTAGAVDSQPPLSTRVRILRFVGAVALLAFFAAVCMGVLGSAVGWWLHTLA